MTICAFGDARGKHNNSLRFLITRYLIIFDSPDAIKEVRIEHKLPKPQPSIPPVSREQSSSCSVVSGQALQIISFTFAGSSLITSLLASASNFLRRQLAIKLLKSLDFDFDSNSATSIASMILGALAAMAQTKVKRLLAHSSIGHVGYIRTGFSCGTIEGIQSLLIECRRRRRSNGVAVAARRNAAVAVRSRVAVAARRKRSLLSAAAKTSPRGPPQTVAVGSRQDVAGNSSSPSSSVVVQSRSQSSSFASNPVSVQNHVWLRHGRLVFDIDFLQCVSSKGKAYKVIALVDIINNILLLRDRPIKIFALHINSMDPKLQQSDLDRWCRFLSRNGVQRLNLSV
nr:F-box/FBD/LRR-repeat protein At1g13570-like [Ipomoea trifida]